MQTIIVATDFSPAARNAADYAAQLAKKANASLLLAHAYMLPAPISEMPVVLITADEIQRDNEAATQNEANRIMQQHGISVVTVTTIGVPSDELVHLVAEKNAGLVVMGMKGSGSALDKMVGSTVNAVIRKSHVPVLVIPEDARFEPVNNIVYATDYSYEMPLTCIEPMLKLAGLWGSTVHLLHVEKPGSEPVMIEELAGRKRMENILEHHSHQFHRVAHENVELGVQQFLESHPAQWLTMVAHRHNLFERLFGTVHTRKMLYQTHIPLLVLEDRG